MSDKVGQRLTHLEPTRELRWISSVDPRNAAALRDFELRMHNYYATTTDYYDDISFSESAWITDPQYRLILEVLREAGSVLEVGCGRANVLNFLPPNAVRYAGIDFSKELILQNRQRHPTARFEWIVESAKFPVESAAFDVVFSVYVIEHTVYPAAFLDECCRVVKPGGQLFIYCPNFLGSGWMTSQRVGFATGGASAKLRRGDYFDGAVSAFDRAIRIPWRCLCLRRQALKGHGFFVNTAPICFQDRFFPDADATYLTYAPEMLRHLGSQVTVEAGSLIQNSDSRYLLRLKKR